MSMSDRRPQELSVEELEQLLRLKKRAQRQERLRRLKAEGRVVEIAGLEPPVLDGDEAEGTAGALIADSETDSENSEADLEQERNRFRWRWLANRVLLIIEVLAVLGLLVIAYIAWSTTRELNQEIAEVQQVQSESVALPTATATPVIGSVVLPSGHKPPINGRPPEPGEAGDIPAHLLPVLDAYVPPPIPTPGPEQARRIQIPALELDKPIVQGDDWEQLKKGVGQHIPSGLPGQPGNIVLSAHNDIYGEIFRHLDKLKPGDEIVISTERRSYTYVVRELDVVGPTEVSVMAPTEHASATLISCYPFLVNSKRIVVFADLATTGPLSDLSS
jgi:sortase A